MSDTPTLQVEIYSDVICPWCYIGKRRFEAALADVAAEGIEVSTTYRAFQLDPGADQDRSEPAVAGYARKFGGTERADAIIDHVSTVAAGDGLEFNMGIAQRANTLRAHRMIRRANEPTVPYTQHDIVEALLSAYFCEGRDVGDVDTLVAIAGALGDDQDMVREFLNSDALAGDVDAEIASAGQRGVTAVPTYIINGEWSIPGAQDADTFSRVLRRLAERTGA